MAFFFNYSRFVDESFSRKRGSGIHNSNPMMYDEFSMQIDNRFLNVLVQIINRFKIRLNRTDKIVSDINNINCYTYRQKLFG